MANLRLKFKGSTSFAMPVVQAGYVAETYTTGLPVGTPFYFDGNNTLSKADQATGIPAVGIITDADPIPTDAQYVDNAVATALPRSVGGALCNRETSAIFTVEKGLEFRVKDEVVASTATGTSGATTLTIAGVDLTSVLKVGDYIEVVQDTKVTSKTQISAIAFATNTVITTRDNLADTYTAGVVTAKNMKGKPLFLGDNSGSSKFSKLGIPYTTLRPVSGEFGQECGYVYSAIEIFVDVTKDILGKTY